MIPAKTNDRLEPEISQRRFAQKGSTFITRHNIPIGRILGIPVGLDYSWLVVFTLFTWMLARNYFPAEFKGWSPLLYWIVGADAVVMLFASVLLHELGHTAVALWYKIQVRSITLFLFGGVAQIGKEPPGAVAEVLIAIAGPLVSLALAFLFYIVTPLAAGMEPLFGLARLLANINLGLVLFNMIPGYPLDGGRVFRAILWAITKNLRRSTIITANIGRFFAFGSIFFGVWQMLTGNFSIGLWVVIIGWFLDNAASGQVQQAMSRGLLEGHTVSQVGRSHCAVVPAELTLQRLVDEHILGTGQRCFLVNREDNLVGLMTLHRIKEVPRPEWATTSAAQVMLPLEHLKRVEPDTELWAALEKMDSNGVNQLPITRGNRVIGMITREDVITFLRSLQELGALPT